MGEQIEANKKLIEGIVTEEATPESNAERIKSNAARIQVIADRVAKYLEKDTDMRNKMMANRQDIEANRANLVQNGAKVAAMLMGSEAPAAAPEEDEIDKKLKPAFADIDKDNSGFIEAAELKNVLKQMGVDMSDEEVEGVLKMSDINGDHKLDYAEYKKLVGKASK